MPDRVPTRRLPVRPDLEQLKHQAKDLLRGVRRGEPAALADLAAHHPHPPLPGAAKLADAQLALARSYGAPSWPRLALACRLVDAIWTDDVETVRELVLQHPRLLHESALVRDSNWGPPLSYAANLGRDRIIAMLHRLGAADLLHALDRAALQGRIDTARALHQMLGRPKAPAGSLGGPAYTLSVSGTEFLIEIGALAPDADGRVQAPVHVVLETDSRRPEAKHRILELYASHGVALPDTPAMALHRGRIDLLEAQLRRDPSLLRRTFTFAELFPPELGCRQPAPESYDEFLPRTPLAGGTLLHAAVEFDELEIARWLLAHGMEPDAPAATDAHGIGGHTALFNAVVCYPNFWTNYTGGWAANRRPADPAMARLLLDAGADPNARASFREPIPEGEGPTARDHRDVTPLAWGSAFHDRLVVSEAAMRQIEARGGHR